MKHALFLILIITTAVTHYLFATFGNQGQVAYAVAQAESSLDEQAVSPTGDYGLMQINLSAHWQEIPGNYAPDKILWLFNPFNNIDEAKRIYDDAGWGAWSSVLNESYLRYL